MEVRAAAAVLLGVALNASAATNGLTALGPNGGTVNRIVYSLNGNAAFMVAAGGFYRSQDGGVTWTNTKSDFLNAPWDVAIDPADAARIYVVAPNAPFLYTSTDAGATFTASSSLPAAVTQAERIAVSHDGATLYLSSDGLIFSSADRGRTWHQRTTISSDWSTQLLRLIVDPSDAATVYAAVATGTTDSAGIFVSRDGATTWTQVASGPEETALTPDLAVNPANPAQLWSARYDGIWVSADRGVHWSNLLSGAMCAVALDPANPAIVYAGTPYGKVYRSANAGTNWSDVTGSATAGENVHLAVNPVHAGQLLAGGYSGVAGSATSGATWTPQQAGFVATSIDGLSADPSTDRVYIHARANGVFYTSAAGTAAQPVNNAGLLALEAPLPSIDVTAIFAQPGKLFASLNTGLTYSTDGGATWAATVDALPLLPGTQQLWTLSSAPGAPQTLLATSSGPIRRSVDRGATWASVSGQPANSAASNILFAPSDAATAYGTFFLSTAQTTFLGIYKSSDAGASWAPVNSNLPASPTYLLAVDPADARIAYGNTINASAPVTPALLKTVDGGVHWSALPWDATNPNSAPERLAVDPLHPNILYGSGNGRLARSVDGGAAWETLYAAASLPPFSVSTLLADPHRPETLYVGTATAGVQQFTVAPDLTLGVAGPTGPIGIGAVASFTYTATNLGPFDATGVRVAVQLPANAQGVTATVGSGTGHCAVSAQVATCTFPVVRKAASSTFTVMAIASGAGVFSTAASVSGEQPDPDLSSNTVSASAMATTLSDLAVTATASATATVGDAVSYTLVASNAGPNDAPAAQLTFQLGAGMTLGTVSSADATCSTTASTVVCDLGSLAASRTATVTVMTTAATAGASAATVSISSGASDPAAADNAATATTTVNAATTADAPPASASSVHGGGGAVSIGELVALLSLLVTGCVRRTGLATGSRCLRARRG